MSWVLEIGGQLVVLVLFLVIIALAGRVIWMRLRRETVAEILKRHFHPFPVSNIKITERQSPVHIRADLQRTIEEFVSKTTVRAFFGVTNVRGMDGADFASMLDKTTFKMMGSSICPPQYEQIDVGEDEPAQTLQSGLWLLECDGTRAAALFAPIDSGFSCGGGRRMRAQIAAPGDGSAKALVEGFFRHIERGVQSARYYRGKVLSLEAQESYTGEATGIKVHRLRAVSRDEVILPPETVSLLERNVIEFVRRREGLHRFRMATKKGLLFYGPPGTGKTHTIRYIAGALEAHTTLLISAEQVGLLSEYMTLARLLQPSIVVIEDVDLIARERTRMRSESAELLLNKLLNEMDGLREDAEILFILTTNRPEELEAALAARPGRIDQAIEFPLPGVNERKKLVRLYSAGVSLEENTIAEIADRTEKVSAAFLKELMRRAVQFHLERDGQGLLDTQDINDALQEILFSGGSLNLKLLGAAERIEGKGE